MNEIAIQLNPVCGLEPQLMVFTIFTPDPVTFLIALTGSSYFSPDMVKM